jgi:hypothetical protein
MFQRCLLRASARQFSLMLEAGSYFENSANFYRSARLNNTEDSHIYVSQRENLKSKILPFIQSSDIRILVHLGDVFLILFSNVIYW